MKASDTQVGGSHYKAMGEFQPWDVLSKWLTAEEYRGYQKGVAIAYLARERNKGRDQDIRKAIHHLQRLVEELESRDNVAPELPVSTAPSKRAKEIETVLTAAVNLICSPSWAGVSDEDLALELALENAGLLNKKER